MAVSRQTGFRHLFIKGLKTIRYFLWWSTTLFKFQAVIENARRLTAPVPGLEMELADSGNQEGLQDFSLEATPKQVLERFALGHKCIVARKDGRIVFNGWIGVNKIRLRFLGKTFSLRPDTAYFYDIRTDRNYQGGKVFPAFVSHARDYCLERNIISAFMFVDPKSGLPVRAYSRMVGVEKIYLVRFRRRLGYGLYSEKQISEQEAVGLSKKMRAPRLNPLREND
jgi:hypothetical protein